MCLICLPHPGWAADGVDEGELVILKQSLIDEDRKRVEPNRRPRGALNGVEGGCSGLPTDDKHFPESISLIRHSLPHFYFFTGSSIIAIPAGSFNSIACGSSEALLEINAKTPHQPAATSCRKPQVTPAAGSHRRNSPP